MVVLSELELEKHVDSMLESRYRKATSSYVGIPVSYTVGNFVCF